MKYKTRIVPENGGYVGYALLGEEVIFTTNNHRDTVMVARELSSLISSSQQAKPVNTQKRFNSSIQIPQTNNLVPVSRNVNFAPPAPLPAPSQIQNNVPAPVQPGPPVQTSNIGTRNLTPPPRRCCGRG